MSRSGKRERSDPVCCGYCSYCSYCGFGPAADCATRRQALTADWQEAAGREQQLQALRPLFMYSSESFSESFSESSRVKLDPRSQVSILGREPERLDPVYCSYCSYCNYCTNIADEPV